MKNLNKTLVDSNNTLWTFDYDMYDNTVTLVSDKTSTNDFAVISQYSIDNALGHSIPEAIVASAQDMIAQDNDDLRAVSLSDIIETYADEGSKQFYA
jgi:hypothetical protein